MKKLRLNYLDFIRTLSMLSIIVFHFNITARAHNVYIGDTPIIFYDYLNGNLGHIGVSLFFIISGVGLSYTYGDQLNLKIYYKKRWLGIFPMFYLSWIVGILYYFFRYQSLNPFCIEREHWTFILTLLGMDGYMVDLIPNYYILGEWFLGCIILMYLVFPVLVWIKKKIGITKLFLIYIIIYILIVQLYCFSIQIDKFVFTRVIDIIFGMFVVERIKKVKWYHIIPALLIILIWFKVYLNINQMYKITIFGMALFLILMYIGQMLGNYGKKIFGIFSKYSYAAFLCHHIVLDQICTYYDGKTYGLIETYFVLIICIVVIFTVAKLLFKLNENIVNYFKE